MTQNERVLALLRDRGLRGLNTVDLHAPTCDHGKPILRLAARVRDLQDQGFAIRSERKSNGTATYFLMSDAERNVGKPERPALPSEPPPGHRVDVSLDVTSLFNPPPQSGPYAPASATGGDWENS